MVFVGLAWGLHVGDKGRIWIWRGGMGKRAMDGGRIRLDGIVGALGAVWAAGGGKVAGRGESGL